MIIKYLLQVILLVGANSCMQGQYTIPGTGGVCQPCDKSCSDCYWDTVVICTSCNYEYLFNNVTNACNACPANCLNCTVSASICDQCKAGYTLETDDTGVQTCVLYWWVIFLWTFGIIAGGSIVVLAFYYIKKHLENQKEESQNQDHQITREDLKN